MPIRGMKTYKWAVWGFFVCFFGTWNRRKTHKGRWKRHGGALLLPPTCSSIACGVDLNLCSTLVIPLCVEINPCTYTHKCTVYAALYKTFELDNQSGLFCEFTPMNSCYCFFFPFGLSVSCFWPWWHDPRAYFGFHSTLSHLPRALTAKQLPPQTVKIYTSLYLFIYL